MCLQNFSCCLVPSVEERMILKSTMTVKLSSLAYILSIFASCNLKYYYCIYTYLCLLCVPVEFQFNFPVGFLAIIFFVIFIIIVPRDYNIYP